MATSHACCRNGMKLRCGCEGCTGGCPTSVVGGLTPRRLVDMHGTGQPHGMHGTWHPNKMHGTQHPNKMHGTRHPNSIRRWCPLLPRTCCRRMAQRSVAAQAVARSSAHVQYHSADSVLSVNSSL
eukprot:283489-Chlamydomonas_euryale.AAC.2